MKPCMFTGLQNSPSAWTWEVNGAAALLLPIPASQTYAKLKKGRFKRCCFLLYKGVTDTDTAVAEVNILLGATLTAPPPLTRLDMGVTDFLCRVSGVSAILNNHCCSLVALQEN